MLCKPPKPGTKWIIEDLSEAFSHASRKEETYWTLGCTYMDSRGGKCAVKGKTAVQWAWEKFGREPGIFYSPATVVSRAIWAGDGNLKSQKQELNEISKGNYIHLITNWLNY